MDTHDEGKLRPAWWADLGRRWVEIPKEERWAMPGGITSPVRAEIQAYQERREMKKRLTAERKRAEAEVEGWAEYTERERAAKMARAVARLTAAKARKAV